MKGVRWHPAAKRCQLLMAVSLLLVTAGPGQAYAEPAWWSRMKQDCLDSGGKPSSTNYDGWVRGGGCVCAGSSVGSGKPTCDNSATASTGSTSGDIDLTKDGAQNLIKGAMKGDAQLTGAGLAETLVGAILGGHEDPSERARQEAAEAARQARIAELQHQAAEEELRRQEETKRRIMGMLKDSDPEPPSGELKLKMLDDPDDDLRSPGMMRTHIAVPDHLVVESTPKQGINEKDDTLSTNAGAGFDTAVMINGPTIKDMPVPPTPEATDVPVPEDPEVKKEQLRVALKKNEEERKALQAVIETLQKSPAPNDAAIKQLQTIVTAKEEDQKKIEEEIVDLTATDPDDEPQTGQQHDDTAVKEDK